MQDVECRQVVAALLAQERDRFPKRRKQRRLIRVREQREHAIPARTPPEGRFVRPVPRYPHRDARLLRRLAGIELRECTTAYRGFKTSLLGRLPLERIKSTGYSFQVEVLYHIVRHTDKTAEFPIVFADRAYGVSKINKKEMVMSVLTLLRLFKRRVMGQERAQSGV